MTAFHLTHMVSWKDLVDHCTVYVDRGVDLPVGKSCGRIHLVDKHDRLKLKNRKYLMDKVCTADDCETAVDKTTFRKNQKTIVSVPDTYKLIPWRVAKLSPIDRFIDSVSKAIEEFAKTERRKFVGERMRNPSADRAIDSRRLIGMLKENGKWPEREAFWWDCDCPLFALLMEMGDTQMLLSFSDEQIRNVLACTHGGQAVGNNFNFLSWHVLRVYLYTNLIGALDLQEKPDEWGPMKPDSPFRSHLMDDCDGQTFLFRSRCHLTNAVYMKDLQAMKELSKSCFRFLYMLHMIRKEVGYEHNQRDYLFGCYGYDDDE